MMAKQRQHELIAESEASRLVAELRRQEPAPIPARKVNLRLGRALIGLGRKLYDEDQPCPDAA
jgi:hypothetical protein